MSLRKRTETRFNLRSELGNLYCRVAESQAKLFVILLFANPAAKCFNERQVGCRGFKLVTTAGQHERAIDCGLDRDFASKAGLACSRLTAEQDAVAASFPRPLPEFTRFREFVGATDQPASR